MGRLEEIKAKDTGNCIRLEPADFRWLIAKVDELREEKAERRRKIKAGWKIAVDQESGREMFYLDDPPLDETQLREQVERLKALLKTVLHDLIEQVANIEVPCRVISPIARTAEAAWQGGWEGAIEAYRAAIRASAKVEEGE